MPTGRRRSKDTRTALAARSRTNSSQSDVPSRCEDGSSVRESLRRDSKLSASAQRGRAKRIRQSKGAREIGGWNSRENARNRGDYAMPNFDAYRLATLAFPLAFNAAPVSPDPCSLLTKDEIQHQVELSWPSGKAERLRSEGVVWSITMQPTQRGEAHICQIAWQAKVNGETQSRGDFSVVVTFAGWLTGSVAAM